MFIFTGAAPAGKDLLFEVKNRFKKIKTIAQGLKNFLFSFVKVL